MWPLQGDVQPEHPEIRHGLVQANLDPVEGQFCQPVLLVAGQGCEGAFQQVQLYLMIGRYPVLQLMPQAAGNGQIPVRGRCRQVDGNGLRAVVAVLPLTEN